MGLAIGLHFQFLLENSFCLRRHTIKQEKKQSSSGEKPQKKTHDLRRSMCPPANNQPTSSANSQPLHYRLDTEARRYNVYR